MSSLRKSQSARENGAKSHGPKTEAGKQRSSQNALRHGLTSQTLVLPSEDPAEFQRLLDGYIQQFQPAGLVELDLVHEIVAAKWRLNRLALIETELLAGSIDYIEKDRAQDIEDGEEDQPLTPAQSLAKAFDRLSSGSLSFLARIESRLERTYSRALQNLLRMQAHRGPSGPPPAPPQNEICTNEPTSPVQPNGYCALDDGATGFNQSPPAGTPGSAAHHPAIAPGQTVYVMRHHPRIQAQPSRAHRWIAPRCLTGSSKGPLHRKSAEI